MSSITLKPATPSDAENLYLWRQDSEARLYNREQNKERIRRRLEQCGSDLTDERFSEYTWIIECENEPLGVVLVKNIDWQQRAGEIGYLLAAQARGRKIGSSSVHKLVHKIFSESRLQKLVAYTHPENERSWRILERLGFERKALPVAAGVEKHWIYYELSRATE